MSAKPSNVILIGMPGSGKSTVGVVLAKRMSLDFVDTDVLIQICEDRTLQKIVDADGHMALRGIEESVLVCLDCKNYVIATGGSAAYSKPAMTHLRKDGVVVFLNVDIDTLRARVSDYDTRGLAKRPDQTFKELFEERYVLYQKYSDIQIDCAAMTQEEVCSEIQEALGR
jgi:shikimate kinase